MISVPEAMALVTFTREESRAIDILEGRIDGHISDPSTFNGAPFNLKFKELISPKVAHAVRRRYEERGNWRVTVMWPDPDPKDGLPVCIFNFMPIFFTQAAAPSRVETKGKLPTVVRVEAAGTSPAGQRVLVRMPTRGRPAQALSVLDKYRTMAGAPVALEVVIDRDDATMMACDVVQRLVALGCTVTAADHLNKIAACNGGRLSEWDILVLASDDMVPVVDGYAVRIQKAMERHYPYLDGALHFDDGFQAHNLCTLPIFGRRLYQQFGYVYEPAYASLFCDTEQTGLLRMMGRIAYVDEKIIMHKHPAWGVAKKDALYERNDALWERDKAIFELREKSYRPQAQFPFNAPPLRLSLCIATLPVRRAQLDRLLEHLWNQILRLRESFDFEAREVEVLVDDRLEPTIGEKRQALLQRAKGHFVAFIDDDDWVAPDYVSRVIHALRRQPDADCASLLGEMTTSGAVVERFEHSLQHQEWSLKSGVHLRSPNHLNAIRRELALKVGFIPTSHAEDFDFSTRLRPHLRVEVPTGEAPLYYYWYVPKATQQEEKS